MRQDMVMEPQRLRGNWTSRGSQEELTNRPGFLPRGPSIVLRSLECQGPEQLSRPRAAPEENPAERKHLLGRPGLFLSLPVLLWGAGPSGQEAQALPVHGTAEGGNRFISSVMKNRK